MKYFILFFMFAILISPLYSQGDYVSVSFTQSNNVTTWANEDPSRTYTNVIDVDVDTDYDYDSYTEDRGDTRYRIDTETITTDTTVTRRTTVETATAVNFTMTFWDSVDANGAFEDFDEFEASWFRPWTNNTSNATNLSRTFQIQQSSVERATATQEAAEELNELYSDLFLLQNQIAELWSQCEAYQASPSQDKEQPALMDQLANLRKQEYALKGEIISQRSEVLSMFNEEDTGLYGWNVTSTYTDNDTTTTNVVRNVTETITESGICFTADAQVAEGLSIEQVCGAELSIFENGVEKTAEVVRSIFYRGPVYMFYDAQGNELLPGKITPNHEIVTSEGIKSAIEIMPGQSLVRGNGEIVRVGKVEVDLYAGYVFNVSNQMTPFTFGNPSHVLTCGVK